MGKQSGKNKKKAGGQSSDSNVMKQQNKVGNSSPKVNDKDAAVFISMAQELKEEGNKMFQKRDLEGAMFKYEKAIKLLPKNHIDVSYLRSNMAACYMQMGLSEYPRAIHECNLALEVTPKYGKALLKRARCYEALNRLDLALRDVGAVLKMEPNNVMAIEVSERVKNALEQRGLRVTDEVIELPPEYIEPPVVSPLLKVVKEKAGKKKKNKKVQETFAENGIEEKNVNGQIKEKVTANQVEDKNIDGQMLETLAAEEIKEKNVDGRVQEKVAANEIEDKKVDGHIEEKKTEDKVVVEEKIRTTKDGEPKKTIKLVLGEDIRWAQLPLNCSLHQLREVISDRFPNLGTVLIKYRDHEGDLVTITNDEELRWAEASAVSQSSIRLYLVQVNPPAKRIKEEEVSKVNVKQNFAIENGHLEKVKQVNNGSYCIDEWLVEFAKLFKNHVGLDSDVYLSLHELGVKVYSEAMEETVTSEEAQDLFDTAAGKFQEMAALALFNWGNVHMSRARKKVYYPEDAPKESVLEHIKAAYDWARKEYIEAGLRYEAALRMKPDFYEGLFALAQQQFEQGKLSWYYATSNNVDLETWPSDEVVQLYNSAEDNMEKGMKMWEELEAQRQSEITNSMKLKSKSQKMGLDLLFQDISTEEAAEQARKLRSQLNILWGTILYERSIMEFKLGIPVWHECLEVAVEKFELAGASPTDIAVMIKNHISNNDALEGLGFRIDEIVQAWNEMYEAKTMPHGIASFRLEPLLRRRVSKLFHALESA